MSAMLVSVAACGSSSSGASSTPDAGASEGGTSSDGAVSGTCSTLTPPGPPAVPMKFEPTTVPDGTGGALQDGTYVLTKWQLYSKSTTSTSDQQEALRVTGNTLEFAVYSLGIASTTHIDIEKYTFTRPSDASGTLRVTCACADPPTGLCGTADWSVSVTGNTVTIVRPNGTTGEGWSYTYTRS